ncbi:MAG: hypothetical protein M1530_03525 [Candidatus Marsarchaeota archaeon]|nr:hypothetical protein [Candidatus Marsarchaeota archaeon]
MLVFQSYKPLQSSAPSLLTDMQMRQFLGGDETYFGARDAFIKASSDNKFATENETGFKLISTFSQKQLMAGPADFLSGKPIIIDLGSPPASKQAQGPYQATLIYYSQTLEGLRDYLWTEFGLDARLEPVKNSKDQTMGWRLVPQETSQEMQRKVKNVLQTAENGPETKKTTQETDVVQNTGQVPNPLGTVTPVVTGRMQGGDNLRNREEYNTLMRSFRDQLGRLVRYSNVDDLVSLDALRQGLVNSLNNLNFQINGLDKSVQSMYFERLAHDMQTMREGLPPYMQGVIAADGSLDANQLYASVYGLIQTVRTLNQVDYKMSMALQGPLGVTDIVELNKLYAQLGGDKQALRFVLAQRYGENGEGLAQARAALGLGTSGKPVEAQYLEIVKTMADVQHPELWQLSGVAAQRYPKSYLGDPGDASAIPPIPPTPGLLSATNQVLAPNSLVETRPSFDFIGRLAFLQLVNAEMPDSVHDAQLGQMMLSAMNMAPGHSALIWNKEFFLSVLGQIGPEASGVLSSEELAEYNNPATDAGRREQLLSKMGGVRQQVFNQAVLLLNAIYANSAPPQRYENSAQLMGLFEKLDVKGNVVSDLEVSNVVGLERGHPEVRTPLGFMQTPYQAQDITTLWAFAAAAYQPTSLFGGYSMFPQVQPNLPMQVSDLNYVFDRTEWAKEMFLSTMPSAWYLQGDYAPNYLGRRANYGMILGSMNEAYNIVGAKLISSLQPQYVSTTIQGGGHEGIGATDLSMAAQGRDFGQSASAEAFGEWGTTAKGTTYSPTQYTVFDQGVKDREYARLQASQIQLLGTNLWTALGTLNRNSQTNQKDAQGNPISVGGLDSSTTHWDYNGYLNSTFPFFADGTTIAFVNGRSDTFPPALGAGGLGAQETAARYDVDVFAKKASTWIRSIDKSRTDELMQVQVGGGKNTLQDLVRQYFAQVYTELGNEHRLDVAVEADQRSYTKSPGYESGTRYGAMLIYQPPGSPLAGGAIVSTAGNAAAFAGFDTQAHLVEGGFYSFNPNATPPLSVRQGAPLYYYPAYELYEPQPALVPNLLDKRRTFMASGTWLAVEQFRGTVFGGWRGQDNGLLVGEELLTRYSNMSSFFHFNRGRQLTEALITAGGKTKKLDLGALQLEDVRARAYGVRTPGIGDEAALNTFFKLPNGDEMMLSGRFSSKRIGTTPLQDRTTKGLFERYNTLMGQVGGLTLDTLMDVGKRQPAIRNVMNLALPLAADGVQLQPMNDLYTGWLANFSMGYKSKDKEYLNGLFTAGITEDGGTFVSGMTNIDKRVAFIAGMRIGGNETNTPDDAYRWLFGTKIRPNDNLAFYLYTSQLKNERMLSNITAEMRDLGLISASGGQDYYAVSMALGNRGFSGIINFSQISGLRSQEIGTRMALGASAYLALAYQSVVMPGVGGFNPADPLVQQALKQNLIPTSVSFDQFKADMYFNMGNNSILTLTGQLRQARGDYMPYDFYFGGRWSWSY